MLALAKIAAVAMAVYRRCSRVQATTTMDLDKYESELTGMKKTKAEVFYSPANDTHKITEPQPTNEGTRDPDVQHIPAGKAL